MQPSTPGCSPAAARAHHAAVKLHSHDLLGHLQQLHGQVSRPGPDFQHHISGLNARLFYNRLHYLRVLQNMLPLGLVELETCGRDS